MIGRLVRRLGRSEEGFTLVETLVASTIALLIGSLLITTLVVAMRTEKYTAQDSEALVELRTAMDRLTKEVRQARQVYSASTGTSMQIWVDTDRDYHQDGSERITWALVIVGSEAELRRSSSGGSTHTVAVQLVPGTAFTYSPAPPSTSSVTVTLTADVQAGSHAAARTLETQVRLRNVTS
jgi:type II secretory pathway pseudopilin PulG